MNTLNIYNEAVLLAGFTTALLLTIFKNGDLTVKCIGWGLIILVSASLGITWTAMLPSAACELIRGVRQWIRRRRGRAPKKPHGSNRKSGQQSCDKAERKRLPRSMVAVAMPRADEDEKSQGPVLTFRVHQNVQRQRDKKEVKVTVMSESQLRDWRRRMRRKSASKRPAPI